MEEILRHYIESAIRKGDIIKKEYKEVIGSNNISIVIYFNKLGIPVHIDITGGGNEYIPTSVEEKLNVLQTELKEALEKEDYLKAAQKRDEINSLQKV